MSGDTPVWSPDELSALADRVDAAREALNAAYEALLDAAAAAVRAGAPERPVARAARVSRTKLREYLGKQGPVKRGQR